MTESLLQAIYLTKNIPHLFVKIGFFHGINVALKRGKIDSELFGLRVAECNLRNENKVWKQRSYNNWSSLYSWHSFCPVSYLLRF